MGAVEKYLELTWEEKSKVKLESLEPYRHLFPKPTGVDQTVNSNANVSHTVKFIPQVVKTCGWQVENYVNQELKGLPLYEACKKLWEFVRYHIEWVRDMQFKEQVRSPRRLIWDGKGDCDCGTTFVNTCLYVYGARNITCRITAYDGAENFSHIYSVVPNPDGGEIIIDFCVHKFNYQKPYSKKEDYNMELQFLDGINEKSNSQAASYADLFGGSDLGELGKLLKKKASGGGAAPAKKTGFLKKVVQNTVPKKSPEKKAANKEKRKAIGKKTLKVVNKINKINPATALLRAGILAHMKLNVLKIAEKIKWGYATREYAQSKGMDMSKYDKVKSILTKTEQIFFAAGGNAQNLKKAILTGHGNRNHEVSGIYNYSENTSLSQLLGAIYHDEFVYGMESFQGFGVEGLGSLGEPATATSIAAASTAMGTLAALLKSIGDLFPNKGKGKLDKENNSAQINEQAAESTSEENNTSNESETAEQNTSSEDSEVKQETETEEPVQEEPTNEENREEANMEVTPSEEVTTEESTQETGEGTSGILAGVSTELSGFYQKNKSWIIPTGIVSSCILAVGGLYYLTRNKEETVKRQSPQLSYSVNGPPKKGQRKKTPKSTNHKKKVLALM